MCAGMVAADCLTAVIIIYCRNNIAFRNTSVDDTSQMNNRSIDFFPVLDIDDAAVIFEQAGIGYLASALSIKDRLIKDNADFVTL